MNVRNERWGCMNGVDCTGTWLERFCVSAALLEQRRSSITPLLAPLVAVVLLLEYGDFAALAFANAYFFICQDSRLFFYKLFIATSYKAIFPSTARTTKKSPPPSAMSGPSQKLLLNIPLPWTYIGP